MVCAYRCDLFLESVLFALAQSWRLFLGLLEEEDKFALRAVAKLAVRRAIVFTYFDGYQRGFCYFQLLRLQLHVPKLKEGLS